MSRSRPVPTAPAVLALPLLLGLAGCGAETWEEVLIASQIALSPGAEAKALVELAPGAKCDRCWRVLPEVGQSAAHPTLCRRCEAVVEGAGG